MRLNEVFDVDLSEIVILQCAKIVFLLLKFAQVLCACTFILTCGDAVLLEFLEFGEHCSQSGICALFANHSLEHKSTLCVGVQVTAKICATVAERSVRRVGYCRQSLIEHCAHNKVHIVRNDAQIGVAVFSREEVILLRN